MRKSEGSSANVSNPCAKLRLFETSGLALQPAVVSPSCCMRSAIVSSSRGRNEDDEPWTPCSSGCSPVKSDAVEGQVQLAVE